MTDVVVGAQTVAAGALLAGLLGFREGDMVVVAVWAMALGLLAALGAIATGVADYVQITPGTPLRRTANLHLASAAISNIGFLVCWGMLWQAYSGDDASSMPQAAALVGLGAWCVMGLTGWLGGSLVFKHGMRVRREEPVAAPPAAESSSDS